MRPRPGGRPARARRTGALVVLVAVGMTVLAGCGGVGTLGRGVSPCFRDLPDAKETVGKGLFVGVRRVSVQELRSWLPADERLTQTKVKEACVLAFRETYHSGDVPAASTSNAGRYALVAMEVTRPQIVTVVVLAALPARFSRLR